MAQDGNMAAQEPDDGGGAPKWMVTFGDALTLLLTFFVLLLTYSTPEDQELNVFAEGFMGKESRPGMEQEGRQGGQSTGADRLRQSVDEGPKNQFPPVYRSLIEAGLDSVPGLSISTSDELEKTVVIRASIDRLFDRDGELSDFGVDIMEKVAQVLTAFPRIAVVRCELDSAEVSVKGEEVSRNTAIIDALDEYSENRNVQFRMSGDIRAERSTLKPGQCEITILDR